MEKKITRRQTSTFAAPCPVWKKLTRVLIEGNSSNFATADKKKSTRVSVSA
jgi:hypothetical protein